MFEGCCYLYLPALELNPLRASSCWHLINYYIIVLITHWHITVLPRLWHLLALYGIYGEASFKYNLPRWACHCCQSKLHMVYSILWLAACSFSWGKTNATCQTLIYSRCTPQTQSKTAELHYSITWRQYVKCKCMHTLPAVECTRCIRTIKLNNCQSCPISGAAGC